MIDVGQLKKRGNRRVQIIALIGISALALFAGTFAYGQELSPEEFAETSLKYRTALHYDPLLPLPLDSLVLLYSAADREDELVGLYRSHIEKYPDDAGAKTVLVRLLQKMKRAGVGELISTAVPRHPEFAPLQYLLFEFLRGKGDPRAIDALSKAIDLEEKAARRSEWLEELLKLSEGPEARAAATIQLQKLLAVEGQTGPNLLAVAKLMQRYEFWELSTKAIGQIPPGSLDPESTVDRSILRAKAELQMGSSKAAAAILDSLLSKLAVDHWRRREVMSLRFSVVASDEEREKLLQEFRDAFEESPQSEAALLDYIDLLIASELQSRAAELLVKYAPEIPQTPLVESRALTLLESIQDPEAMEKFLSARLELDPERVDLRFLLVKVLYALKRDADAAQEFQAVLAGQEAEEVSNRILELQRYLRSIDRIEAAGVYLERFVSKNPERLSIARELAEVYLVLEKDQKIEELIPRLMVGEAPVEEVLDLSEFLLENDFFVQSKQILSDSLSASGESFPVGILLIEALGEMGDSANGDRLIKRMRDLADSPERYSQWLEVAVAAYENFETLDRFFEMERSRFSFSDGTWPEERVEKFVMLCEIGRQRQLAGRVTQMVREQLEAGSFDSKLRIRLRQFLVAVLQADPNAGVEMEEQLKLLIKEDPDSQAGYELQLALFYHRGSRIDLAQELLLGLDLAGVNDAALVQEAVDVLLSYRFFVEAERALAAVNRLAPADLFSWEKRLTLLALLKEENDFRSLIRLLRNGEMGEGLSSQSLTALDRHMVASHWRSVSRLFSSGNAQRFEEILPLLASVERVSRFPSDTIWTEWSRAMVLQALGRSAEVTASVERFEKAIERLEVEEIVFPDGLALSVQGARRFLLREREDSEAPVGPSSDFLFSNPSLRWAYRIERGTNIERFESSGDRILILDSKGGLSAIDQTTGKLIWSENLAPTSRQEIGGRPSSFFDLPGSQTSALASRGKAPLVKRARSWTLDEKQVVLISGNSLVAFRSTDGKLLWSAPLPFEQTKPTARSTYSRSGVLLSKDGDKVFLFHPDSGGVVAVGWQSGKLLWETELASVTNEEERDRIHSLNSGISSDNGLVFVYGEEASVLDGETGRSLWFFSDGVPLTFPVVLRKDRSLSGTLDGALNRSQDDQGDARSTQRWQTGDGAGVAAARPLRFLDFLRLAEAPIRSDTLTSQDAALVGPASFWSVSRTEKSGDAMGFLSNGYLWLMGDGAARRVSTRFPVASRSLPGEGIFVGQQGNHAWLLNGKSLQHMDFYYDRSTVIGFEDLGPEPLRTTFVGNQLIVRGEIGIRAVNARTGNIVGTTVLPERLRTFLEKEFAESNAEPVKYYLQGAARIHSDGSPQYCYPASDLLREGLYVTQFRDGLLVCLEPTKAEEVNATEAAAANPIQPE